MSKSYKSLPNKVSKKQRKLRRTRRTIRQRVPTTPMVEVDEDAFLEYNIPQGLYARDENGQWRRYEQVGPNQFDEDPFEEPIEDPEAIEFLRLRSDPNLDIMYEQTPYMDLDEEPTDIYTPYGQMAPRRKHRRTAVRQRAIQDFADESEGDVDSPYDDFSREEDMDAEIYPEDYEPTPEYFQMAPKRKHIRKNRKTIKKLGGSRRRYKKMN